MDEIAPFFKGMKCLVTGAAGFIGSHLVDALIQLGANVIAVDDFTTGKLSNLQAALKSPNCTLVRGDVRDYPLVASLVKKATVVFHQAARVVAVSLDDPVSDMNVNIGGTMNVLMAAKNSNVSRLVYASSASVYGNSRYLPMNEDDPINPLSPYAVSKLAGDNYARVFFDHYKVPTVCLRYFNIYGPRQSDVSGYGGVISIFGQRISTGKEPVVYGDGTQTRDFTEIGDAINATLLSAISPRAEGEVFNVGTGVETTIDDLAKLMIEIAQVNVQVVHAERRTVDNVRRRVANIEKARRLLRYEPFLSQREGLKRVLQYYSSQPVS